MRKFVTALAILALAAVPAFAQEVPVRDITSAVDTDAALLVWFVGDDTTAAVTVTVAAGGDISFNQGGAADTTIECPLSGAYGGVIDVSDAACDTLGEVVDIINTTSGSEWRAAIVAGFATDSSNDTLLAQSATEARGDGDLLLWDSSVILSAQVALIPGVTDSGNVTPVQFARPEANRASVISNPYEGQRTTLFYASENITSSGTVAAFTASCVVPKLAGGVYSESVSVMYTETGANTTVTGKMDEFNYANGGLLCDDGKVVVRQTTDTDLTAQTVFATGRSSRK